MDTWHEDNKSTFGNGGHNNPIRNNHHRYGGQQQTHIELWNYQHRPPRSL